MARHHWQGLLGTRQGRSVAGWITKRARLVSPSAHAGPLTA